MTVLAPRAHAADRVFEALAAEILAGTLKRLPPERVLAARHGVSRIIVRQAVHRLADMKIVRVRQGGATTVLDPYAAADVRVIDLYLRLGPKSPKDVRDAMERQVLTGHALLCLAEKRGRAADIAKLARMVEDYVAAGATAEDLHAFEAVFWRAVAAAGGNRLYRWELAWWFDLLARTPRARHPAMATPAVRGAFYRDLVRRLREGVGAAGFYLDTLSRLLWRES